MNLEAVRAFVTVAEEGSNSPPTTPLPASRLSRSGWRRCTTSASGIRLPVPGIRYSQRTGSPVSLANSSTSANRVPVGVENTTSRHSAR
jgi:hypothetical protein